MSTTKEYYQMSASEIYEDVHSSHEYLEYDVEDIRFIVYPHVYPSQKFRTTAFVLRSIRSFLKNKTVCDMGCGPGIVGLYALSQGAKKVIQADINPYAFENAKANNNLHKFPKSKIESYLSDCFDNVPHQKFDIIVFNMPYHNDDVEIKDPLQRAFYDPNFRSIKKFLSKIPEYSTKDTEIFIAFSNKGDIEKLETIFDLTGFNWELWKITNTDKEFDNRIYRLKITI